MAREKISLSWSGGKDCSFALYRIICCGSYDVVSLHTTIDAQTKKVGLHGISEKLIEKQAEILKIPLEKIYLNNESPSPSYEELMVRYYEGLRSRGINKIISGDIFLEDLRKYKEDLAAIAQIGIIFPLWGSKTKDLLIDFVRTGFKAKVCAIDSKHFSPDYLGKDLDLNFIKNLSDTIDPCGEYGEYHTFTYNGPIFPMAVPFLPGSIYSKDYSFNTKGNNEVKAKYYYEDFIYIP